MATKSRPATKAKPAPAANTAKKPATLSKPAHQKPKPVGTKQNKAAAKQGPAKAKQNSAGAKQSPAKSQQRTSARPKPTAAKPATSTTPPDLYSSLHAMLHTMRLIEQHDEPLCSMHDELKRTGKLSAAQRRHLQRLVDELPAQDYQHDLDTLRQAAAAGQLTAA